MSDFTRRLHDALSSDTLVVEAPCARESDEAFARSVADGLAEPEKRLHCRYLYDEAGSQLFESITDQPEYYPTRTEAGILEAHAEDVCGITGPVTLVELGSGYSKKTQHLLSAYRRDGAKTDYVPVDVSMGALREASRSISGEFGDVNFTGISGTYASAFPAFRHLSPQMIVFLGSTVGNFDDREWTTFWESVAAHLPVDDFFLLGVDLVKEPHLLEAAYNDAARVTARFMLNYIVRMNRELGTDIDLDRLAHVAEWNPERERMEMFVRFDAAQRIHLASLNRTFDVEQGERILIETSRKFRLPRLQEDLSRFGFRTLRVYKDERDWFGLVLLQRVECGLAQRQPAT